MTKAFELKAAEYKDVIINIWSFCIELRV